jgi:hypothetical protein
MVDAWIQFNPFQSFQLQFLRWENGRLAVEAAVLVYRGRIMVVLE